MDILFSGIQPSGNLHIGNYLGAIKQFVELQDHYEAYFCIVDEHAITVPQDPKELLANTLGIAALYLAAGIDPAKAVIFVQSHVPAHAELGWMLNTLTPLGELERMTQFKEKRATAGVLAGLPAIASVKAGLLNYPTLMAADILLYQTHKVPVGEDQLQHIELTRALAKRFNNRFGKTFTVPRALLRKDTARIMGLDDPSRKMSKSAPSPANYVALLDSPADIRKKIKSAVTDSGKEIRYDEETKPAISNLMRIYGGFADLDFPAIEEKYRQKGYAQFKSDCADILIERLAPLQKRYRALSKDKSHLVLILREGAQRASTVAEKTLRSAREKMGFLMP